ncbi:hypothetical protein HOY80DRAFT_431844 [Tuber brumale]|nr:hypothetical protein HOY80DRAFT_431844 [Tuber brumale]
MDFNSMRGNGPFTMSPTSVFPEAVRSLPSPSPSIAFKSSASSVGNMDDLSTTALGNPSRPSFTLSPPESLATLEDGDVSSAGDSFLSSLREGSPSSTPVMLDRRSPKGMHSLPKITYSRKVIPKGKKRPAEEAEILDYGNDTSLESSRKRIRVVGLKNLGNTCYNNAVIQALSHTCALREYFLQRAPPATEESDASISSNDSAATLSLHMARPRTRRAARLEEQVIVPTNINLCDEFARLLKMMWINRIPTQVRTVSRVRRSTLHLSPVISPHKFASAVATVLPSFHERHEQQDAQEFLRCSLERMQDELASEQIEEEDTIVQTVFGGILWNKIICHSCSEYTIKPDPFLDLSLVIPEQLPPVAKGDVRSSTLEECLNLFATTERLEGSPPPPTSVPASTNGTTRSCLSCGSEAAFSKSIAFGVLPHVLCIHLKRFRWRSHKIRGGKQKVDTHVRFPLEGLDMKTWCEQDVNSPILYDLYAVVVHQGTGANFGHYVAYTKHQEEWWLLDDDRITKVPPEAVAKSKAYLLFYKRRDDEISPNAITDDESQTEPTNESCTKTHPIPS